MKKAVLLFSCIILVFSGNALASTTFNFATGQDSSGAIQTTGNSMDAYWIAINQQTLANVATFVTTSSNVDWFGNWGNIISTNSSWIAPYPNQANNGGYTYNYIFNLTGYDLSTAVFSGLKFAIDDSGYVFLNGVQLAYSSIGGGNYYFTDVNALTSNLVSGQNRLSVVGDWTDRYLEAMRFEGTLTINSTPMATPLPAAAWFLCPGLLGLVGLRRKICK